jgi:hypothetical protein
VAVVAVRRILEMMALKENLVGKTGRSKRKPTRTEAAPTRCRSALRSRTAAAAASLDRRQPLQPLVLPMEMETKVKTPEIKIRKEEIRETIKDKTTLIMAVVTAAAEMKMLIAERHLNVEWNFVLASGSIT